MQREHAAEIAATDELRARIAMLEATLAAERERFEAEKRALVAERDRLHGAYQQARLELELLRPRALANLVVLFQRAQSDAFERVVRVVAAAVAASPPLAEALSRSDAFVSELAARFSFPKAEVQRELLELARAVTRAGGAARAEELLLDHNLPAVVQDVSKSAKALRVTAVHDAAERLLEDWAGLAAAV